MTDIRVVIVDDDPLVRRALSLLFATTPKITVLGDAADGLEALAVIGATQPDVVLMDVNMPRMGGIEATAQITSRWPDARVLALASFGLIDSIVPMLRAGATGYVLKSAETEELFASIRAVHAGTSALSAPIISRLMDSIADTAQPASVLSAAEYLTARERDVVDCLARGMSNAEIGASLRISEGTVKAYLANIMAKWNTRDRVQLLIKAAQVGIVNLR